MFWASFLPSICSPYSGLSLSLSLSHLEDCAPPTPPSCACRPLFSCSANATADSMALFPPRQSLRPRPARSHLDLLYFIPPPPREDRRNVCGSHARVGWRPPRRSSEKLLSAATPILPAATRRVAAGKSRVSRMSRRGSRASRGGESMLRAARRTRIHFPRRDTRAPRRWNGADNPHFEV